MPPRCFGMSSSSCPTSFRPIGVGDQGLSRPAAPRMWRQAIPDCRAAPLCRHGRVVALVPPFPRREASGTVGVHRLAPRLGCGPCPLPRPRAPAWMRPPIQDAPGPTPPTVPARSETTRTGAIYDAFLSGSNPSGTCLFVDDRIDNVRAAVSKGMRGVLFGAGSIAAVRDVLAATGFPALARLVESMRGPTSVL